MKTIIALCVLSLVDCLTPTFAQTVTDSAGTREGSDPRVTMQSLMPEEMRIRFRGVFLGRRPACDAVSPNQQSDVDDTVGFELTIRFGARDLNAGSSGVGQSVRFLQQDGTAIPMYSPCAMDYFSLSLRGATTNEDAQIHVYDSLIQVRDAQHPALTSVSRDWLAQWHQRVRALLLNQLDFNSGATVQEFLRLSLLRPMYPDLGGDFFPQEVFRAYANQIQAQMDAVSRLGDAIVNDGCTMERFETLASAIRLNQLGSRASIRRLARIAGRVWPEMPNVHGGMHSGEEALRDIRIRALREIMTEALPNCIGVVPASDTQRMMQFQLTD